MTSDAASSEPRKRSWKRLIVVLACVVAVITIVLLANAPKKEPVKVWFVRSTNELGLKKLVFQATNGLPTDITLSAWVVTGETTHAKAPGYLIPSYGAFFPLLFAGRSSDFALDAPPNDVTYHVEWMFDDMGRVSMRREGLRSRCFKFFNTHGMPHLADRFVPKTEVHCIPSTEIKE